MLRKTNDCNPQLTNFNPSKDIKKGKLYQSQTTNYQINNLALNRRPEVDKQSPFVLPVP